MIVGFSGYLRSGKDTAAQALIADGYEHRSFAKALKDMAYNLNPIIATREVWNEDGPDRWRTEVLRLQAVVDECGWEMAKDRFSEIRALLQRMGTDAGRKVLGENIWVNTALRGLSNINRIAAADDPDVVFTDVRFPNEADGIAALGGLVIRINRPGFEPGPDAHISETALDDYPFDVVIDNTGGIDDLYRAVRAAVGEWA